jgi:alanine racemase
MPHIKLSKANFFHNLEVISNKAQSKDKVAIVLKDNAYGHGLVIIAELAHEFGIKRAVVQSEKEAKKIVHLFEYILVLADKPKNYSKHIHYTVNSLDDIERFNKGTKIELKVDSGMHRNGIDRSELREAFKKIRDQKLIIKAIFTHQRSADELSSEWFWQNEQFSEIKKESKELMEEFGFRGVKFHSANSASLFRTENFDEDMVRVGISAYGCLEMPKGFEVELKPVLSLSASRVSKRVVKKGEKVGYGATFCAQDDCVVSNYDFGYGDGFMRLLSNNYTTQDGYKQVGKISMDNASFLAEDEEIVIFNDACVIAKEAGTISYEILTSLDGDITREVV